MAKANPYDGADSSVSIQYMVSATGNSWFNPTIGSDDSVDFTASKTEAAIQCAVMSPNGSEVVVA